MTSMLKLLGTSVAIAAIAAASAPAMATTTAGTDVNNTVSVTFQVGGVTQTPPPNATNTFKVDRKILFTITEKTPVGTTNVSANQTGAITAFTLTNTSNDVLDFVVTPSQIVTGGATPRGTDAFNLNNLLICLDANNDNACDSPATATLTVDNLAQDTGTTTVLIIGDIPASATNGQIAGVTATASARNSNGSTITAATDATVNDPTVVETIFADPGRDNSEAASDDYTVAAAALSVFKSSRVTADGVSASNFKAIPGATVEYCISVANASGAATASNINISDAIPANTTYVPGSIRINGTVTSPGAAQTCSGGTNATDSSADADGGQFGSNTVSGTLANIAGGASRALLFSVTIN
ncbi:hypothetical protein ACFOWX_07340 [Sphingorhabdus arenilitoris]|uniref:DUF11 domain-containing protein n=1 Tax=Sphingorhabdus arenilitoris TaxID=1490041 RepID=A0ABV8RIT1_9SPHN